MPFPFYYGAAELSESAGRLTRHSSCRRWDRLSSPSHRAALPGRRKQSGEMKSVLCREQGRRRGSTEGGDNVYLRSPKEPLSQRDGSRGGRSADSELKQASEIRLILLLHLLLWSSAHVPQHFHHQRLSTCFHFTEPLADFFRFFASFWTCSSVASSPPLSSFLSLLFASIHLSAHLAPLSPSSILRKWVTLCWNSRARWPLPLPITTYTIHSIAHYNEQRQTPPWWFNMHTYHLLRPKVTMWDFFSSIASATVRLGLHSTIYTHALTYSNGPSAQAAALPLGQHTGDNHSVLGRAF